MFQGGTCKWGDYHLYGAIYYGCLHPEHQLAFKDDTVTYDGHSSIRIEGPRTAYNWARELNNYWVTVSPGDNVTFSAYIKTNSQAFGYGGAIGVDVYSATQRLWEVHKMDTHEEIWTYPTDWSEADYGVNTVGYGSDWTFYQINFTIPTSAFTITDNGTPISPQYAAGIIPWIGASHSNDSDAATVWVADTVLIVNPSDWEGTSGESGSPSGGGEDVTDTIGGTDSQIYPGGDSCLHASAITASDSGVLKTIGLNIQGTTGNVRVGIYSTLSGGKLSGLLGESESTAVSVGWNNITVSGSVEITEGVTYYLAVLGTGGLGVYVSTGGTHYYVYTAYGALPNPSGTLSSDAYTLNMRITYETDAEYTSCFVTSNVVGSGNVTYLPSNVTTAGVTNGTWIDVSAVASDGYVFSYANITNTATGTLLDTITDYSFSYYIVSNITVTSLFTLISSQNVPTVSIVKPAEITYTSGTLNISIASTNAVTTWYNVKNGTDWVYTYNVTYTAETTLTGYEAGSYTCYAWAVSNSSLTAMDTVDFTISDGSLPIINMNAFWLFLYEGNFLGGVQSYLATTFLNLETAIALIAMLFLVPLYLRTKSLMLICVLWILLGGFFIAALPMASGLAVLFMTLGIGGMVWRLFRGTTYG